LADSTITSLTTKATVVSTDELIINDVAGGNLDKKILLSGVKTFVKDGLVSADVTDLVHKTIIPIIGGAGNLNGAAMFSDFSTANGSDTESDVYVPLMAGTLKNFRVYVRNNTASNTNTITVRKNGVDTALVISITAGATGLKQDTTHSVAFTDGDLFTLSYSSATGGEINLSGGTIQHDIT
jgi:hypothetical protein